MPTQTQNTNIPEWWIETTLWEVWKVITWKTPSRDNPEDWWNLLNFITPTDFITDSKFLSNTTRQISEIWKKRFQKMIVPKKSIIITCIWSDMWKVVINSSDSLTNQQINSLIINENNHNDFIYYKLKNSYSILKSLADWWSTMPILNKSTFENIKIVIPEDIKEQQAIASILSSFDDKIELLREQNETLEKTAQTIFQEWFGKYRVEDELSEGWRVGKLGEIIDNYDAQRIPISSDKREKWIYPYYGATGINDFVNNYIFDWIYTLLWEDWSVIKENWKPFTQYVWWKIWVNNHSHVLQGKNWFSTELIKIILDNTDIAPYVNWAVQLKINQTNMNSIPVIIPNIEILEKINEIIQPLFLKIRINSEEIQTLSKTRDELLPRLMRGEVRVV